MFKTKQACLPGRAPLGIMASDVSLFASWPLVSLCFRHGLKCPFLVGVGVGVVRGVLQLRRPHSYLKLSPIFSNLDAVPLRSSCLSKGAGAFYVL